ncbi:MAG: hypothetical protein KVP17_004885 [Porospora cf. gigantea B]|uniref:uncharacterized protein n=1 Tax=Porospora cf. gigantea B TaxID=2853592 RepID=UPI0035719C8D|nr:MAG: hypothetical protein KVP17_004885 [Porospora cf. gigantea B]
MFFAATMTLCVRSLSGHHSREAFELKTHLYTGDYLSEVQEPSTVDYLSEVQEPSTSGYYSEVPEPSAGDYLSEVQEPSTVDYLNEVQEPSTSGYYSEVPEPSAGDYLSEVQEPSTVDYHSEVQEPSTRYHSEVQDTSIAKTPLSTRLRAPTLAFRTAHAEAPHPSFEQGVLSRLIRAFNSAKWMMTHRRRTESI